MFTGLRSIVGFGGFFVWKSHWLVFPCHFKPFEITFLLFLSLKQFLSWLVRLCKQKLKHCLVFPCPSYLFILKSFQLSPALPTSLPSFPWRAGKAGAGALCCLSDCCGVVFVRGRSRDKKTTRQGWAGGVQSLSIQSLWQWVGRLLFAWQDFRGWLLFV